MMAAMASLTSKARLNDEMQVKIQLKHCASNAKTRMNELAAALSFIA